MRDYTRAAWLIILGMAILFVDFLTKAYVYYILPIVDYINVYPYGGIGVFREFLGIDFSISLAINRGAAWGVLSDFQGLLLLIRMLAIMAMLIYLIFINHQKSVEIPLVLVIAGAIGNVVDFFLYGFVVDFFHFNFWGYHFPVFNVADSVITIGVTWLFLIACSSKNRLSHHV